MDGITIATWTLAGVTLLLAGFTLWLVFETRGAAKRQLGVQTWLSFVARFDSREMRHARKSLASLLATYDRTKHDKVNETVLDFFEDLGIVHAEKCIDPELIASSFSYYCNHWFEAAKSYIDEERRRNGADGTLFEDFENLSKAMRDHDPVIDALDIERFLADEKRLKVN